MIGSGGARGGTKEESGGATVPSGLGSVVEAVAETSAVDESACSGGSGRHSALVQLQLGQTHLRELNLIHKNYSKLESYDT